MAAPDSTAATIVGRYAIYDRIAAGGMATVHLGRLLGQAGFARTVAIKKMHAQFAADPEFVAMFLDEARLVARIRHPNVVSTLDVVARDGALFLVMDYIEGESLAQLLRLACDVDPVSPRVVASIVSGILQGLHAAHEATNERGDPLGIVHRDVSPQNVMVGADGVARVLDFGVAKALGQSHSTRDGQVKGKMPYMSAEQITGGEVTRRSDIFAVSVVLWEALTGLRLFKGESDAALMYAVLNKVVEPPSKYVRGLPETLDEVVLRGLDRDPSKRFATAAEMADALEEAIALATTRNVAEWVRRVAGDRIADRAKLVGDIESGAVRVPVDSIPPGAIPPAPSVRALLVADDPQMASQRSQASSISVETPRASRSAAPLWAFGVMGASAVVLVLAVVGFVFIARGRVVHGSAASATLDPSPPPSEPAPAAPAVDGASGDPTVSPSALPSSRASATRPPKPLPSAMPRAPAASGSTPPAKRPLYGRD